MSDSNAVSPSGEPAPTPDSAPKDKKPVPWWKELMQELKECTGEELAGYGLGFLVEIVLLSIFYYNVQKNGTSLYWLTVFVLMVLIVVVGTGALILLGKRELFFSSRIPQSATTYFNAGEKRDRIIPNVTGFKLSKGTDPEGRRWLVPARNKKERYAALFEEALPGTKWIHALIWQHLGILFIAWTYSFHTLKHRFNLRNTNRLVDGTAGAPLPTRIHDTSKDKGKDGAVVDNLRFLIPRPVLVAVTLGGDNSQIMLLLQAVYRQVIPELPVYHLDGDFFSQLDGALETYAGHAANSYRYGRTYKEDGEGNVVVDKEGELLTYAIWKKMEKSGDTSEFVKGFFSVNTDQATRNLLEEQAKKTGDWELVRYFDMLTHGVFAPEGEKHDRKNADKIPSGILGRFGFVLESIRLTGWQEIGDTAAIAAAARQIQTNELLADALVAQARGEREANEERATGVAALLLKPFRALAGETGYATPDVAARVIETQMETSNIAGKDSKITTYIRGTAAIPAVTVK